MAKQLPPAKQGKQHGAGNLQQSSKAPVFVPEARDQTPEERATSHAQVAEAYERAGLGTPERREAYHNAIQTHVPRMIAWYDTQIMAGRLQGHGDVTGVVPQATAKKIYQRPQPEEHH